MTKHPITLAPHELRAALAGTLRQVRRPVTFKKFPGHTGLTAPKWAAPGETIWIDPGDPVGGGVVSRCCPLGQPGDVLWGRETWQVDPPVDGTWDYYGFTDGQVTNWHLYPDRFKTTGHVLYRASWKYQPSEIRWRSSTTMPRWASRFSWPVTAVRVEQMQDMTDDDALALGVTQCDIPADEDGPLRIGYMFGPDDGVSGLMPTPREAFVRYFQEEWDTNPWQWVVEIGTI